MVCLVSGCGRPKSTIRGKWQLDLDKTVEHAEVEQAALQKLEKLIGRYTLEFGDDEVTSLVMGKRTRGSYSVKSRSGDMWVLEGKGGELKVRWIDQDTILLQMAKDPAAPMQGLVLVRE